MSWFDGLLAILDRMPTERLAVMRDVIGALVERRRVAGEPVAHTDIESAIAAACADGRLSNAA